MAKEPNGHRYIKQCLLCSSDFRTFPSLERRGGGKYCSIGCARKHGSILATIRNSRTCKYCKEEFATSKTNITKGFGIYCSRLCQNKYQGAAQKGVPKVLTDEWRKHIKEANALRRGMPSSKKGKSYPHLRGENHWAWKGGADAFRKQAKGQIEYKNWRIAVFERDNYTCQICEQYGGVLHADHIVRWADDEELRYAVDNGRTLCVPCHYYVTFKKKMNPGTRWCGYMAGKRG